MEHGLADMGTGPTKKSQDGQNSQAGVLAHSYTQQSRGQSIAGEKHLKV